MRRALQRALRSLIVAAVGCGGAPMQTPPVESSVPTSDGHQTTRPAFADEVIEGVARVRRLPVKRPIVVEQKPLDAFRAAVIGHAQPTAEQVERDQAWALGFGFLPPFEQQGKGKPAAEAYADAVLAFYDIERDVIVMPDVESSARRAVFAHEVEHALIAQHMAPHAHDEQTSDEQLAELALHEGDAMVAMGAFVASERGFVVRRALRELTDHVGDVDRRALMSPDGLSGTDASLPIGQARLAFPYDHGMRFVADLYRTGGFDLVNKAFAAPPTTTEQILHPQKYLDGEGACVIAEPTLPSDAQIITSGTLGAYQVGVWLRGCEVAGPVADPAFGWAGDRYTVATRGGELTLHWVTAWDDEATARAFESRLERATCLRANRTSQWHIGGTVRVERRGTTVVLMRGAEVGSASALFASVKAPAPSVPPFGELRIPKRRELAEGQRGTVEGASYRSTWLGLTAPLPMSAQWSTKEPGLELLWTTPNALGAVFVSERMVGAPFDQQTWDEMQREMEEATGGRLGLVDEVELTTTLGRARRRTWSVRARTFGGRDLVVRAQLVPICAGTGSIAFISASGGSMSGLDRWVNEARWLNGRLLPICERLNPT